MNVNYCKYCGAEIAGNQSFCIKCGKATDEIREPSKRNFKKSAGIGVGIVVALFVLATIGYILENNAEKWRGNDSVSQTDEIKKVPNIKLNYEKGTLTDTSYSSLYFDLKLSLPTGWVMLTEDEINSQFGEPTEQSAYEMVCFSTTTAGKVLVMTEKLPTQNMTVEQYMEVIVNSLAEQGMDKLSDDKTKIIAGKSYNVLEFMGSDGKVDAYIRKVDDRIICMIASAQPGTQEAVEGVLGAFTKYDK